jgi:two-component system, chemotaxis family, sensor kinase CheA
VDTESLKRSLLSKFVEVTQDRLQSIQLHSLKLEVVDASAAEEIARDLHTMKGEARMLGLASIGQLVHACEDLLKRLNEKQLVAKVVTDLLLQSCDAISDLLDDLDAAKQGTPASTAVAEKLSQASGIPLPPLKPGARPKSALQKPPATLSPIHPSSDSVVAANTPKAKAETTAARPESVETKVSSPSTDRSIRVQVETLDALGLLSGDLLVESARARLKAKELQAIFERFSRLTENLVRLGEASLDTVVAEAPSNPKLRPRLQEFESDLHLLRDDAFRFVRSHSDGINMLRGSLGQMAEHVSDARLVPLASIFEAFPRAVREMAEAQGKHIDLVVDNASVGVDRGMVNEVRDALVHLIRNAVDHGIEAPDLRSTLGKSEHGKLTLRARADGDMLAVEVEDDGRGIDANALREIAVQRGLLSGSQAKGLSDREAIELIFRSDARNDQRTLGPRRGNGRRETQSRGPGWLDFDLNSRGPFKFVLHAAAAVFGVDAHAPRSPGR